ncbi:MAG: hypothetical protein AABY06_02355 [Nanoarchaeota archaeon]
MECFICGVKRENATLFSAIVQEGVVPVCEECSIKEKILVLKRVGQLRESERNLTVYERLSTMAGLDPIGHKEKIRREEQIGLKKSEIRKPLEKKIQLSFPNLKQIQPQFEEGLVRNYHWTIFNARRSMKQTQKQLAETIGEPEASIKLVERGILPDNYLPFIRKLQTCLGVTLFNNQLKQNSNFNKSSSEVNAEEKKEEIKVPYWKKIGFLNKNKEKRKDEELGQEEKENKTDKNFGDMRMLTREEIDRITFSERKED